MKLEQIHEEKSALEAKLKKLFDEFMEGTGVRISHVELNSVTAISCSDRCYPQLQIELPDSPWLND